MNLVLTDSTGKGRECLASALPAQHQNCQQKHASVTLSSHWQEDENHAVGLSLCSITANQSHEQEHPPPLQQGTTDTNTATSPSLGWVRELWGAQAVTTLHEHLTRLIQHCSLRSVPDTPGS